MTIPAGELIRVTVGQSVYGVTTAVRKFFITTIASPEADLQVNANLLMTVFLDQYRRLVAFDTTVVSAVLDFPRIPAIVPVFLFGASSGARSGLPLPATCYARCNTGGPTVTDGKPIRNQMRISGISAIDVHHNHFIANLVSTFAFFEVWMRDTTNLGGTFVARCAVARLDKTTEPHNWLFTAQKFSSVPTDIRSLKSRQS